MRRLLMGGLLALAGGWAAHAQVTVELLLEQRQYLINETLEVGVRVVNRSGQTLEMKGADWLSFALEESDGFIVKRLRDTPAPEPFEVASSYMATQWIDINGAFEIRENTQYRLRARMRLAQWNEEIYSAPVTFEVIRGTKLWEQVFGVPPTEPTAQPEIRKYILQQANYLKELQLYVRVTDERESEVIRVLRLAPMVQISKPEAQIDTLNQLHVLTQLGIRTFMHATINPDGELILRNTYEATDHRPKLRVSPSGGVYVAGGVRQLRRDDIPTPEIFTRPLPQTAPISESGPDGLPPGVSLPRVVPDEGVTTPRE